MAAAAPQWEPWDLKVSGQSMQGRMHASRGDERRSITETETGYSSSALTELWTGAAPHFMRHHDKDGKLVQRTRDVSTLRTSHSRTHARVFFPSRLPCTTRARTRPAALPSVRLYRVPSIPKYGYTESAGASLRDSIAPVRQKAISFGPLPVPPGNFKAGLK